MDIVIALVVLFTCGVVTGLVVARGDYEKQDDD